MPERRKLTPDDVARLITALQGDAAEEHLSEEDLVNRAFNDGSAADLRRIDGHVASCDGCRDELQRTRVIAAEMNSEEQRPTIDRLWNAFITGGRSRPRLKDLLAALTSIAVPAWHTTRGAGSLVRPPAVVIADGSAMDDQVQWQVTRGTSVDLHCAITCVLVERLRGATIHVNTTPVRAVALIEQDQKLRAEFDLSEDEWRRMYDQPLIGRVVLAGDEDM